MPTNVTWRLGYGGAPTRVGFRARSDIGGQVDDQLDRYVRSLMGRAARRLSEIYEAAYPTLSAATSYVRRRGAIYNAALRVDDARFFYHEFDTEPHWPP